MQIFLNGSLNLWLFALEGDLRTGFYIPVPCLSDNKGFNYHESVRIWVYSRWRESMTGDIQDELAEKIQEYQRLISWNLFGY